MFKRNVVFYTFLFIGFIFIGSFIPEAYASNTENNITTLDNLDVVIINKDTVIAAADTITNASVTSLDPSSQEKQHTPTTATTNSNQPATTPSGSSSSTGNIFSAFSPQVPIFQAFAVRASPLLHATGIDWLFFAFFSSVVLFLLGACLRLHSGRSPGYRMAI